MYELIVARDINKGIGMNGSIPWHIPVDLAHFKDITTQTADAKPNLLIMGRKTWDSIPFEYKTFTGRRVLIISTTLPPTFENVVKSVDAACSYINKHRNMYNRLIIIGGSTIYKHFLEHDMVSTIHLTEIEETYPADTYFNFDESDYTLEHSRIQLCHSTDKLTRLTFKTFKKVINKYENNYLSFVEDILKTGKRRDDRTGVGTISKFGGQLKFNLENNTLPLLTTKFVSFRVLATELLWFISGSTDAKVLQDQNVHIWDGNSSQDFIHKQGLPYSEGDIGANYGFQWRHSGAEYKSCKDDYTGQGVDQLSKVIDQIKNDPYSRRIAMSAWCVSQLDKMTLKPCHILYQFYVEESKDGGRDDLSCHLYQRSSDTFLGLPFNIASASLLTHIIAKVTGKQAKELIISFGDAHIYSNHVTAVEKQLERSPTGFPKIFIKDVEDIDNISLDDFTLTNYKHQGTIRAEMAV